jgi:TetR/AcrR family fatty acid metabolism transcriptional regulator
MASDSPPVSRKKQERLELKQALKQVKNRSELRPEFLRLKERQRQEREQLILNAADELLREKGYHETSIDEIAARVGISKGTVYLHFASKDDLVFALIERGMRELQTTLDAIFSSPGTPREKLRAVIEQFYARLMSQQRLQLVEALFRNPEVHTRLMERREQMGRMWTEPSKRITTLLEEGKAAGEFDRDTPTPVMLSLFWSMISPHTHRLLVIEQQMSSDLVVLHLSRFFFKGVAPGGPPCSAHPTGSSDPTDTIKTTSEGSTRA